jgi:cysteine desulfurase
MQPYLRQEFGNPSSDHPFGHRARAAVERARQQVAAFLGCNSDEVIFTSGGTEANNLAIRGAAEAVGGQRHVLTTAIEHPATAQPCAWLARQGWRVTYGTVDEKGVTRLDEMQSALSTGVSLVTVMHANNETGVVQPVAEVARLAHGAGAVMHTDAAQSVGKIPVDVHDLGIDLLSLAGHKVYGPKGIGALYVRRDTNLSPFMRGASHERGLRPGTENVAAIAGLGAALERVQFDFESTATRLRELRDELWNRLRAGVPGVVLNGHPDRRLPNTLNVRFPGTSARALLRRTPEVAASAGAACHSGQEQPSGVLTAMGIAPDEAIGSIRLTLGRTTTPDDIARAADALVRAWMR